MARRISPRRAAAAHCDALAVESASGIAADHFNLRSLRAGVDRAETLLRPMFADDSSPRPADPAVYGTFALLESRRAAMLRCSMDTSNSRCRTRSYDRTK
jgi:hypothetical protein